MITSLLAEQKYFIIVLNDGEEIFCIFLSEDSFSIHVDTAIGELLVPEHSIKYFILGDYEKTSRGKSLMSARIMIENTPGSEKIVLLRAIRVPEEFHETIA